MRGPLQGREREVLPMRQRPTTDDKAARPDRTASDGWNALFGGRDFVAKRPSGEIFVVSAI
jgi:hypothetical protein